MLLAMLNSVHILLTVKNIHILIVLIVIERMKNNTSTRDVRSKQGRRSSLLFLFVCFSLVLKYIVLLQYLCQCSGCDKELKSVKMNLFTNFSSIILLFIHVYHDFDEFLLETIIKYGST